MAPCRLALRLRSAARDGTRTTGSRREEAIHQSAQSPQEVRKTSEDGRLHPSVANDITAGQPQNWTLGRRSANQPDGPPEAGAQGRILPGAPFRISCTSESPAPPISSCMHGGIAALRGYAQVTGAVTARRPR